MTTSSKIMSYAERMREFSRAQILSDVVSDGISAHTLDCALSRLVSSKKISRDENGKYTILDESTFRIVLTDIEHKVAEWMASEFPFMKYSLYNGQTLSPIQHHLSYNTITYLEVDRWDTQTVFDRLRQSDLDLPVYLCPDSDFIYNYIDLDKPGIVVKRLISEAPLQTIDGICVPTLEKLLIDIQADPELSYLGGAEASYMMDNARALYTLKDTRLRRYAKRRSIEL